MLRSRLSCRRQRHNNKVSGALFEIISSANTQRDAGQQEDYLTQRASYTGFLMFYDSLCDFELESKIIENLERGKAVDI
jgi:hypothetical protein